MDERRPRLGEFTREFTVQEDYLSDTLVAAGELMTACDQLHYALAYLSGYRSRRTPAGELITRSDYLAYQLENLHLRLGMVPDRAMRLANVVFRLGLPAREIKSRTVTDNENVRTTPVRSRLRALDKIVDPHRETRNAIVHHQRYSDPGLARVETYFLLEKSETPFPDPIVEQLRLGMKSMTDAYVDSKRRELEPVAADVIAVVEEYFESLLPVFEATHRRLG